MVFISRKHKKKNIPEIIETPPANNYWKLIYICLSVSIIIISGLSLLSVLQSPSSGWDYRVYMGTISALNDHKDPYVLSNLQQYTGGNIPMVYPPHTFLLFSVLSWIGGGIITYWLFILSLILISTYFIFKINTKHDYILFITLLLSGFFSMFWIALTGNYAIIFMFFISIFLYLFYKEKFTESSIIIGIMSSLSFFPFLFTGLFLLVKRKITDNLLPVIISAIIMSGIFIISYIIYPSLIQSFIYATLEGDSSIINESQILTAGGLSNPTPYLMFGYILHDAIQTYAISAIYIILIAILTYLFIHKNKDIFTTYCFGLLSIIMILPRIKPYSFIMAVIPVYFLLKNYDYKTKIIALVGISIFPFFTYYDYSFRIIWLPNSILWFGQTISLFFIYGYLWYLKYKE